MTSWLLLFAGGKLVWDVEKLILLATQIVGFMIVAWVIKKFVWKHLVNGLNGRSERIREAVEGSERGVRETQAEIDRFSGQLNNIDKETMHRMDRAKEEAEQTRESLLAEARNSARDIAERAQREVGMDRDKALYELRHNSIELTLKAAEAIVTQTMDEATQDKMVQSYIRDLEKAGRS